ncbi:MAG TPA: hypothetical protein VMR50_00930 [Myxococcota bacterium]|nr:hypothetical protein [Myxococcota bacterium]
MKRALLGLMTGLVVGCTSAPGTNISELMERQGRVRTAQPPPGDSLIVFVRADEDRAGTQATIYEIADDGDHFVGVSSGSTRLQWAMNPGTHLFMVLGEAADFLRASVAPDKTYYMQVMPRFGFFKARFSFRPVRREELGGPEWMKWQQLELVRCGIDCSSWVRSNVNSIQRHKDEDLRQWLGTKSARISAGLLPEDGW